MGFCSSKSGHTMASRPADALASHNDETDSQLSSTNYNTSDDEDAFPPAKPRSKGTLPPSRNAANARERARMRVLARAFCRLKTTLPWVPADTKLSKLDTLRLATSYIAYLREVLMVDEEKVEQREKVDGKRHPVTMSWPFSFGTVTSSSSSSDRHGSSCPLNSSPHKSPLSLPDCRNVILNTEGHSKENSIRVDLHENNNWEVADGVFSGIAADQRQLMGCHQRQGDKDIGVSYY